MAKGDGEVKLLGLWASPFVMRATISLHIKSVEYEFIHETLYPKSEFLLKSNPVHKKIPVFFHHDKTICESLIIVQYIDETWSSGPSILPSDPYDRAIQRFWAAYIDDKWFPNLYAAVLAPEEEVKAAALEQLKEGLALLEDTFVKCSKGQPFFNGDTIGYLDIAFGCYLGWLKATEKLINGKLLDEANTPSLLSWADRFCADNAVKDVMPESDKLIEFAKVLMEKNDAAGAN